MARLKPYPPRRVPRELDPTITPVHVDELQAVYEALAGIVICSVCNNGLQIDPCQGPIWQWRNKGPMVGERMVEPGEAWPENPRWHCCRCHIEYPSADGGTGRLHHCYERDPLYARCPECEQLCMVAFSQQGDDMWHVWHCDASSQCLRTWFDFP